MSTTKEYRDYILEQLEPCENVTSRQMMGEYLLYCGGRLFGGIYDNRLLVKITGTNGKYGMAEQLPYDGAKPMYFVEETEDRDLLKHIVTDTCAGLAKKK